MDKIIVPFNLYIIREVLERKPDIKTLDLSKNDPLILTLETTLVTELKTSIRSIFQGFFYIYHSAYRCSKEPIFNIENFANCAQRRHHLKNSTA